MSFDGVLANPSLLSYLNTLHGKQVLVETKAGQQYVGIYGASSPEMEIGLSNAYMKTPENQKNILAKKDEIVDKMVFKFADVVCVSVVWNEEKAITGFATDRDYHSKANGVDEELEEWNCDDEGEEIENYMPDVRQSYQKNGGWSVDEMFNVNSNLHGVQSTFVEDMSQYTTVDFHGTDEEKARAEQIAREIEQSSRSKFYSRLENDDDERDLDKQTTEDDLDSGNRKKGNRNSFGMNNNANTGRRGDKAGGQVNRRAEQLRNDRRGSGQQLPPQQQQQRFSQYSNRGQPYVAGKRNSTGGDDQFGGEWQNPPKEIPRGKEPKVFENTAYKGRGGKTAPTGRADELRQWNTEFTKAYKQNKDDVRESQSPVESHNRSTSGNAWNNGPPSSLLSSQQQTTSSIPPQENSDAEVKKTTEQVGQLDLSDDKASENADSEKTESGKKFTFNPDAPAFTPRLQPPTTPTQAGPMQQQIPMGMVSMQPGLPPGMIVQAGQPIMGHWQPNYVQMQSAPYQVAYLPAQPMVSQAPIQGQRGNGGAPPIGNFTNPPNQRRNGPGQQPMMVPNAQWTPGAVVVNPMGYYQYPTGAGQPGQQFPNNPMVQQGQQGVPNQMFHQQRYPMGYMVPQGAQPPRYPTGQQPPEVGQFQPQSSAASTTGASSQPPTPGPQPPTVASPGQQHPSGGRGSPAPPPPAQQFVSQQSHINMPPHAQQAYYPPQTSLYMYNPSQMVVYPGQVPMGQMPMGPDGQPQQHMDGGQQQQQFMTQDQQYGGQFIPPGPQYYQQHQQPMSRQNSVPQNFNNGQPNTGAAPPIASHPTNTSAPPPPPVPQPVNSSPSQN